MIIKAFSIFDIKTGAYALPFFMHHVGEAVRACMDAARDPNTNLNRHPGDFELREVGFFDTERGYFGTMDAISHGVILGFLPRPQPTLFDPAPAGERLSRDGMEPHPRSNGAGPYTPVVEGL